MRREAKKKQGKNRRKNEEKSEEKRERRGKFGKGVLDIEPHFCKNRVLISIGSRFRAPASLSIFEGLWGCTNVLVAPYCAIPGDYLSDTPVLRAMGFLVSQHGQLGAIPPPPFLSISPLESMQSGGAIPPPQKGYLGDTGAILYENKANGLSRKGIARYGGVSRTGPLSAPSRVFFCVIFDQKNPRAHKNKIGTSPPPVV